MGVIGPMGRIGNGTSRADSPASRAETDAGQAWAGGWNPFRIFGGIGDLRFEISKGAGGSTIPAGDELSFQLFAAVWTGPRAELWARCFSKILKDGGGGREV